MPFFVKSRSRKQRVAVIAASLGFVLFGITDLLEAARVGPILATTLLAYVPELGHVSYKTLACIVGVAPHPKQSGNMRGKSAIRSGRSRVRHVL